MIVRRGPVPIDLGPARGRVEGSGFVGGPVEPRGPVSGAEAARRYAAAHPERKRAQDAAYRARRAIARMLDGETPPATVTVARVDGL